MFEIQAAAHGPSMPTALTASHSGRYVYAGEGSTLAVLELDPQTGIRNPLKRIPISSRAVLPVAMALDPEANVEDGVQDAEDVLYVAAGRDGLWAMQANPLAGAPNPAVRIDDSAGMSPTEQNSRRWACAVDFAVLGGTRYLVCLFSAAGDSRLRIYPLSEIRARVQQAATSGETGVELAAAGHAFLMGNPASTSAWPAFGYDLVVDQAGGPSNGAMAYVALGAHGLVRVKLQPPSSFIIPTFLPKAGPWFGDGSPYVVGSPPGFSDVPNGLPHDPAVYDDLYYYDYSQTSPYLERQHAPLFTSVAVHGGYLYAAVESCGWVRFRVREGDQDLWAPDLPIDHHEGWQYRHERGSTGTEEVLLSLVPANTTLDPTPRTWTRRIRAQVTDCGPILAVTTFPIWMAFHPGTRNEGRTLSGNLAVDHLEGATAGLQGKRVYTLLYDLSGPTPFAAGQANQDLQVALGGKEVFVPPVQGPCAGEAEAQEWLFFASPRSAPLEDLAELGGLLGPPPGFTFPADGIHSTYRVLSAMGSTSPQVWARGNLDSRGRYMHQIGVSAVDQRVVIPASNDAGMMPDGVLWTCWDGVQTTFRQGPDPDPGPLDPQRLNGGIIWNTYAKWTAAAPRIGYIWGTSQNRWALTRYTVGNYHCLSTPPDPPQRLKTMKVSSPNDRFDHPGRGYLSMGTVNAEYDAHYVSKTGQSGARLLFGSRTGSDWGVVVMRADLLQQRLNTTTPPLEVPDGAEITLADVDNSLVGTVVTHREFAPVLDYNPANTPTNHRYIFEAKLEGKVNNFAPRIFEVPAEEPEDRLWLLAAPAGHVALPPVPPTPTGVPPLPQSQWPVPPFSDSFEHWLVELVDITDPARFHPLGSPQLPSWTLIGAQRGGLVHILEAITFRGRTYLFVADFTGELSVFDLTDLRSVPPGPLTASAFPPFAQRPVTADLSDPLGTNLYGLAIDVATWVDESETPREELYVYLGVSRVGIEVLRLAPDAPAGSRLVHLGIVQTPGESEGLWIRTDPDSGQRQLLVANKLGGVRLLGYSF